MFNLYSILLSGIDVDMTNTLRPNEPVMDTPSCNTASSEYQQLES